MRKSALILCGCLICFISYFSNPLNISEDPLKIVQYEEDGMIEIEPISVVKNVLILNEKGAIVGHIEEIQNRMILKTDSWPKGTYALVYTMEGQSYKQDIQVK